MFVKYFIPEDGDEQAHPNVFRLDSTQPTYSEIKTAFPVAGAYHFRFLKNIGSHIVWLDVTDDGAALPLFQGSIFIKVSRIANSSSFSAASSSKHEFVPSVPAFHSEAPVRNNDGPALSPPVKAPKPPVLDKQKSEKLLKFDDDGTSSPRSNSSDFTPSAPAANSGASLLHDNDLLGIGVTENVSNKSSAASADLFGLDTLKPMSTPVAGVMGGGSTNRSHSPMNPLAGGMASGMGAGMGGGMAGKSPMGTPNGSMGSMGGMGGGGVMGGGPRMQQQQPQGGAGGGMGMGGPPQRGMGGPGTPGYDPFNNIAGLNGLQGRGAGPNGRR